MSVRERIDAKLDALRARGEQPTCLVLDQRRLLELTEELRAAGVTWRPSHPYWNGATEYRGLDIRPTPIVDTSGDVVIGVRA